MLRRSMATAAAMAALRRRRTRDDAKRKVAHLRHDCGRCKVETVEKGEAELRARPIGEWGGGERGRARRSSCDGNGDGGCYDGCAEVKEEAENENGSTGMERARAGLVVVRSGLSWPR